MSSDERIAQVAQDAASDVRAEVAERQARAHHEIRSKRRALDSPILLATLLVTLVLLTALNLTGRGLLSNASTATPAEIRQGVAEEVDQIVMDIDAAIEADGEVPESVDDLIPPATDAWSYERLDSERYRLSLTLEGETVEFETER